MSNAGIESKGMDISSQLSDSLVELSYTALTRFQGEPLSRGVKYTGWENLVNIAVYL